jgi:hypothetical protein
MQLPQSYKMLVPPLTTIDGLKGMELTNIVRQNTSEVLSSALTIEDLVKELLLKTLLSEVIEKKDLVVGLLLDSDWCGFNAKIRMLLHVLEKEGQTKGKEKDYLSKLLRKVVKYRNALAHGVTMWDGTTLTLRYFEAGPRADTLDDSFWQAVEAVYLEAFEKLIQLQKSLEDGSE